MKKLLLIIAAGVLLLLGYNEYQKYKLYSAILNADSSSHAVSVAKETGVAVSDFKVVSFSPRWEDGRMRAIGEIQNIGKLPGGPHVEVIARDDKGELVDSVDFWPNSVENIQPGGSCGVKYTITRDSRAKTAEIKVIGANVW